MYNYCYALRTTDQTNLLISMLKLFLRALGILFVLFVAVIALLLVTADLAPLCFPCNQITHRPLVIAHQGGDNERPSNTLLAMQYAVDLGVDMLEMDIHATSDGVLVLSHDETLDRLTNGSGLIKEKKLAEIKQIDAAYDWSVNDKGDVFPYRGQGVTIPTLEEIFQAFPQMPMNIEVKQDEPSIAEPLCALIRQYKMEELLLVASFKQKAMEEFRKACPEVTTSLTADETKEFFYRYLAYISRTYSPPAAAAQVPEESSGYHVLTPRFVADAHNRGMELHVWTINDKASMVRMLGLGVDGIITDNPSLLLAVLEKN